MTVVNFDLNKNVCSGIVGKRLGNFNLFNIKMIVVVMTNQRMRQLHSGLSLS